MRKQVVCTALLLALNGGFAHAQPLHPPDLSLEIAIGSCAELQNINNNLTAQALISTEAVKASCP